MTALPSGRNRVRIIAGKWRSRIVKFPAAAALRPTPDRVRETLFNWLGQDLSGWRCIDAFAGTGALGFEAASRGAAQVLVVEQDPQLVEQLRKLQVKLQATIVEVRRGNGLTVLGAAGPGSYDLVLLDPPFESDLWDKALAVASKAVSPEGFVYLEASTAWDDARLAPHGLVLARHMKAGAVHAHLLRRAA